MDDQTRIKLLLYCSTTTQKVTMLLRLKRKEQMCNVHLLIALQNQLNKMPHVKNITKTKF